MTRAEAHGSAACESSKGAWQQQRNAEGLEQAPEIAHLLEVLEERYRPASCTTARHGQCMALRIAILQTSRVRGLARQCREIAARRAWMFEYIVDRTYIDGRWRRS